MRCSYALFLILIGWGLASTAQPNMVGWLTSSDFGALHLVVPEDATDAEQTAAKVFADFWKQRTGETIGISTRNQGLINVWIGRAVLQTELIEADELESLGQDGFIIRAFTPSRRQREMGAGKQLIIAALTDAGTINGVYEFLERYAGIRWITPGLVGVSKTPFVLNDVECVFRPCFQERQSGFNALIADEDETGYLRAHKFRQPFAHGPFGEGAFYWLLPPERFFAQHPEYFAELRGARTAWPNWRDAQADGAIPGPAGQLCCSNPDTAAAIVREVVTLHAAGATPADADVAARRAAVLAGEAHNVVNVSPMPWGGACECGACREIDEREGSPAGSLLTLVNRVAQGLRESLPDAALHVHVLLPPYARRPPASLRPEANVSIQLSMAGCDYLRPLNDAQCAPNAAFVEDIEGWSRCANDLYVWDFGANLANPLRPHPNLHVFQSNYQLLDRCRVTGVYVQARAAGERGPGDFDALRSYVIAEALWDPDFPSDQAREDFLSRYYGPAAKFMRDYWALLQRRAVATHVYLHPHQDLHWLDFETVSAADALFQGALSAKISDDVRRRLERDYLGLQYAALVCPPRITIQKGNLLLERPPAPTLDEFVEKLKGCGEDAQAAIARVRTECGGTTPPRSQAVPLAVLEDESSLVWIAPALHGAVVRWQDKPTAHELLRGYTSYGAGPALFHEIGGGSGAIGVPFAPAYEIVQQTPDRAVLEATREDGLVLRRTIALGETAGELSVSVQVKNGGSAPVDPTLSLSCEFAVKEGDSPELWTRREENWERQHLEQTPAFPYRSSGTGPVSVDTALYFPGDKRTVVLSSGDWHGRAVEVVSDVQPGSPGLFVRIPASVGPVPPGGSQELNVTLRATPKTPPELVDKRPAWAM